MTLKLAITLLGKGKTGNEILSILEAIASPETEDAVTVAEPTLDPVQF